MNFNSLNTLLNSYWTKQKVGKHADMPNQHGLLLMKNLKTDPEDFFEKLKTTGFKFQEFDTIPWSEVLSRSGLADFLKPEYVDDALKITTTRPAIGKGEFLFVSCFNNIGFASGKGDLVDLGTNSKIEVKGVRSTISGDGDSYKMMNNSIITTAFAVYDTSDTLKYFNRDCAKRLEEKIKESNNDKVKLEELLKRLQNVKNESRAVARTFVSLYNENKPNLFSLVGAMQLYMYMKEIEFLLMVNDIGFKCIKNDNNPETFVKLFDKQYIKLSSWETGARGMEMSI